MIFVASTAFAPEARQKRATTRFSDFVNSLIVQEQSLRAPYRILQVLWRNVDIVERFGGAPQTRNCTLWRKFPNYPLESIVRQFVGTIAHRPLKKPQFPAGCANAPYRYPYGGTALWRTPVRVAFRAVPRGAGSESPTLPSQNSLVSTDRGEPMKQRRANGANAARNCATHSNSANSYGANVAQMEGK